LILNSEFSSIKIYDFQKRFTFINCLFLQTQTSILKYIFTFLTLVFFFSCDKKQENITQEEDVKPLLSVVQNYSSIKQVQSAFKQDVDDWKELEAVDNFLARFKKVSPKEILTNALELRDLTEALRDSIKPELFNDDSFKARVNIFYNETLRLADMTTIPAITADEVNKQNEKIIDAFSAIIAKVNAILTKKQFEDAIEVDVKFIGLDSTKMDSVSKKSIRKDILNKRTKSIDPRIKEQQ
jgi:ketopantoate reductase